MAPDSTEPRIPLNRQRVLRAAVQLADREGIESVSMRRLGQEMGVEAMSLYSHIRNKDDLLNGIVDAVVSEIDVRTEEHDWKTALRRRILAARSALLRHPWVVEIILSRTHPGPATLAHMEALIRILREDGFSLDLAHHAMHLLGSRALGFSQDLFTGSSADDPAAAVAAFAIEGNPYPYITEMANAVSHDGGLGGCDDDVEFVFALELILGGLERLRGGSQSSWRV